MPAVIEREELPPVGTLHGVMFNLLAGMARRSFLVYLLVFNLPEIGNFIMGTLHAFLARTAQALVDGQTTKRLIINVPPQHGKALEDNTPVPTPQGWRSIGSLQVGDYVYAPDGQPTIVLAVRSWKERPLFRVTCDDGTVVVADAEHEWDVRLCRKRKNAFTTHTTAALACRTSTRAPMLPAVAPVAYPAQTQPVPAYILGCHLGDGTTGLNQFTADIADQPHYFAAFDSLGFTCQRSLSRPTRFRLRGARWISRWFRSWGLHREKHIPTHYLRGSVHQRYQLLQGLIDTDGYVAPDGQVEFCNTNYRLATDVLELVHSLGIKAQWLEGRATLNGVDCGPKYRVIFYAEGVASLPRKAARLRAPEKSNRYITSVVPCGTGDTTCIQVAHPSSRFLAGKGCIPTHNSTILSKEFVSWVISYRPGLQVAMTGYSHGLLTDFSKWVRRRVESLKYQAVFPGTKIREGDDRMDAWTLENNESSVRAHSVGKSLVGRPVDLLIIDDPHSGRIEAESALMRKRVVDWYLGNCMTRLSPQGMVLVISTRWHKEDLCGYLLSEEYEAAQKEQGLTQELFTRINIKALSEAGEEGDPLGRTEPEQAAFPEVRTGDFLRGVRAAQPDYEWESQYQGNPMTAGSGQADVSKILRVDLEDVPRGCEWVRAWDLAVTQSQTADFSAGALLAYNRHTDILYIVDMWHDRLIWPRLKPSLVATVKRDKAEFGVARCGVEGVSGFKIGYHEIRDSLMGEVKVELRNPGSINRVRVDKLLRAQPWLNKVEAGKVRIVKGAWNRKFITELTTFPEGTHDDQVDAVSIGYEMLHSSKLLYA